MAYMVKLTAMTGQVPRPVWVREPSWWQARELQTDPRFKERDAGGFVDYEAVLTAEEASELNRKYAEHALSWQQEAAEELRLLLTEGSGDFDNVLVEVLEWESGL
jgi:hypothetical protein